MPDHYIKGTSGTIRKSGLSVTDGSTTVDPTTRLNFTSGATVSDLGSGEAGVAVSGGGGGGGGSGATRGATINDNLGVDSTQTIAAGGASATILLSGIEYDDDGYYLSPGIFEIPADPGDGIYRISVRGRVGSSAPNANFGDHGLVQLQITTGGDDAEYLTQYLIFTDSGGTINPDVTDNVMLVGEWKLVAGDQIKLLALNNLDDDFSVVKGSSSHKWRMTIAYMGTGSSGAFAGALVGLKERFTSSGAPHEAAFDTGASLVDYPVYPLSGVTISGNTLVVGTDGIWRIEFSVQVNYDNGIVGPTIPEGTVLWVQCSFTGWIASNATYGFGAPMSSAKVTDAEPTDFQNMFSASIAVPMHAGDTVKVRVQSYNGTRTDVAGLFGIQRLGDIPT